MKILIKNAVQRKEGFMYSIDADGNIIESLGPSVFNNKKGVVFPRKQFNNKKTSMGGFEPVQVHNNSTIRTPGPGMDFNNKKHAHNSTIRKSRFFPGSNSTIRKRMSSVQKEILLLVSTGPIKLNDVVLKLGPKYFDTSIYRSIDLLVQKKLIIKKREREWFGPFILEAGK